MRGSIRRRSKGSWEIYLDTGRDVRGKRLRHYETIRGVKRMHSDGWLSCR